MRPSPRLTLMLSLLLLVLTAAGCSDSAAPPQHDTDAGTPDFSGADAGPVVPSDACTGFACPSGKRCQLLLGTPTCTCDGYERTDGTCLPVTRCAGAPCFPAARCEGATTSTCGECPPGFWGDGVRCVPLQSQCADGEACRAYYRDDDRDGVGRDESACLCAPYPPFSATRGGDCDDNGSTGASCAATCATFYPDQDADGLGAAGAGVAACSAPLGHVTAATDCDDDNPRCGADCTDADADGACAALDCDDSAATGAACSTGCTTFYRDSDQDALGALATTRAACAAPEGFVATAGDCDDGNDRCGLDCTDADQDGACAGRDCDDSPATGAGCAEGCQTFHPDADGDGSGAWSGARVACQAPERYLLDDSDCDDSRPLCDDACTDADGDDACAGHDCDDTSSVGFACTTGCATFYRDVDGDGFGDAAGTTFFGCLPLSGYAANAGDCNDSNDRCAADCTDRDADGACGGADCDDSPATGASCQSGCAVSFPDVDGDGHGDPTDRLVSCAMPAGRVGAGTDCDDSNAGCALSCVDADDDQTCADRDCDDDPATGLGCSTGCATYYRDADGDGHGDVARSWSRCAGTSAGWVSTADDCDDQKPGCALVCTDLDDDGTCADHDCDDSVASGGTCATGCVSLYPDSDRDGLGSATAEGTFCGPFDGYVAVSGDCDDARRFCGTDCTDADSDARCVDQDCDDGDGWNWSSCTTCADTDADGAWTGCDRYGTGKSGPDCAPADATRASGCTGTGEFSLFSTLKPGLATSAIAKGDFDGDGILDLAIARDGPSEGTIHIALGNGKGREGDGTFTLGRSFTGPELLRPSDLLAADLDGDQIPDLAVITQNAGSGFTVMRGRGDGDFAPPLPPVSMDARCLPSKSVLGDLDADGDLDLATALPACSSVVLHLNDGHARFTAASESIALPSRPRTLIAARLDAGASLDLAIVHAAVSCDLCQYTRLSVAYGAGDGRFAAPAEVAAGSNFSAVAAGDITGDGVLDLAVADSGTSDLLLYAATAPGQFAQKGRTTCASPSQLALADLDGDGREDLIAISFSGQQVVVKRVGAYSATFGAWSFVQGGTGIFTAQSPVGLLTADFTGDGVTDLAVPHDFSGDVRIFKGAAAP